MDFSNDSEILMTFLMKDFHKFARKRSAQQQHMFDSIILNFYKKIKESNSKIDAMWRTPRIKREMKETPHLGDIRHSELIKGVYVPEDIRRFIKRNTKGIISYKGSILGREMTIKLYLTSDRQFNELAKIDLIAKRMFVWLYFIIPYTNTNCSRTLTAHCYLCPHKKELPQAQFTVLGPSHVNGGVTTACPTNGEICIYREEELFKVFIHETFHAFGLDWSNMISSELRGKLKALFPISSTMDVSETYTEFWATIFNCLFTAFYLRDNYNNKENFLLYAEYCIYCEQIFSLFQCVKILQFMGIYYKTLFEMDDISIKARKFLYKEKSNIFAYYILKMVLLMHADQFITWCIKHNSNILNFKKTNGNLNKFYEFIKQHYDTRPLLQDLDKMHQIVKRGKKYNRKVVPKSLRMTVIEVV